MSRLNKSKLVDQDSEIEQTLHRWVKQLTQDFESSNSLSMAEQEAQSMTLANYARHKLDGTQSSIVRPPLMTTTFELKPNFIQLVQQSCLFHGLPYQNSNVNLSTYLEACDMLKLNGVTNDAIHLRSFRFH